MTSSLLSLASAVEPPAVVGASPGVSTAEDCQHDGSDGQDGSGNGEDFASSHGSRGFCLFGAKRGPKDRSSGPRVLRLQHATARRSGHDAGQVGVLGPTYATGWISAGLVPGIWLYGSLRVHAATLLGSNFATNRATPIRRSGRASRSDFPDSEESPCAASLLLHFSRSPCWASSAWRFRRCHKGQGIRLLDLGERGLQRTADVLGVIANVGPQIAFRDREPVIFSEGGELMVTPRLFERLDVLLQVDVTDPFEEHEREDVRLEVSLVNAAA